VSEPMALPRVSIAQHAKARLALRTQEEVWAQSPWNIEQGRAPQAA